MPFQVRGQSVATNSFRLPQAPAGAGEASGAGAGALWARAAGFTTTMEASAARAHHVTDRILLPLRKKPSRPARQAKLTVVCLIAETRQRAPAGRAISSRIYCHN